MRWVMFTLVDGGEPVLVNMEQDILVESKPWVDASGVDMPGMLVCGKHVRGDIGTLHVQTLGGETFGG